MNTSHKVLPILTALAVLTCSDTSVAKNTFSGFSLAPTFSPPPTCVPADTNYGLLSRCEQAISPGHGLFVYVDTVTGAGTTTKIFVDDHVQEISSYWKNNYAGKLVSFSSRHSKLSPGGHKPAKGTECREYNLNEVDDPAGDPPTQVHWRIAGLTCAWYVEHPDPDGMTIELFWLEVHEGYDPAKGAKPIKTFDAVARDVFRSVQLLTPPCTDSCAGASSSPSFDPRKTPCFEDYEDWRTKKGWKAMAISEPIILNGTPWQTCTFSTDKPTKDAAEHEAMDFCQGMVFQNSINSICHIVQVGEP